MKKININILKISLILFCMIVSFGATTYYTIVPNMSCNASKVVVGETCIYTGSATFYPSQPDPMPEVHYNFSFPQGSIIGASTDGHIVTHKFTEPGTYDIYFDAYADNTEDIIYITEAPAEAEYEVPSIDGGCSRSPSGTAHVHLNEASPFELEASVYYLPSGQIASDFGGAYITIPGPYPQDSTATVSITGGSASAGYQKVTGTVSFSTYGNHFLEYGADVAYSYPSNNEIVWFEQAGAGSSLSYIVDRPTHLILDISTRDISASIDTATSISTIINVNGGDNIDLSLQVKYADTTNASGAPLYYQMSENNFVTVDYTNTTGFGVTDGDGQALLRLNTKSEYSGTVNVTLYCNDIEDVSKNKIIVQIICRGLSSETSPHPYAGGIIDVYTGQFNFSVQDISVPGRGMSLNFTRTYSTTREPMSVSEFYATKPAFDTSFHWTYNYNAYIDYNDAFANVTTGSGRKDFYINTAGGYRPPRSMHTQLIKSTGTTGFTLKEKDGTKYIFDKQSDVNPSGLTRLYLTKIYDKNNNSLTLSYETSPVRLTCVADDFDRKITIEYESITPPPAPLDSYTYRIKKVKDPIGRETVYSYNNDYNLSSIAYPDGTQASYSYEKPGDDWFITSYTDPKMPKGITHRSFTYTTYNNKRYACDITDGAGKKELHIDPSGIEGSGAIVYTSKSSNGVENSGGDYDIAANTKTTYKFTDSCWTETVDDLNRTSKYTWDYNLNQLSVEDPINRKTYYTYDEYGNKLTSSTTVTINSTPVTVKSLYEYENRMTGGDFLLGLLTKSTDPLGKISKNEYDTSGNLVTIRTQEPLGALTEANMFVSSVNTYNTNGQVVTTVKYLDDTQTTAITTAFEYDNTNGAKGYATGQLLKAKLPNTNGVPDDAYSTSTTYDTLSRKITETDQMGLETSYTYDNDDKVSQIDYADGTHVHYDYDTNGNLVTITDAKGVKTRNVYDERDRLTNVYAALGTADESHVEYSYDNENNKVWMKVYDSYAGTVQTDYAYDELNRLSTTTDHPNSNGVTNRVNTYSYDTAGRKVTVVDSKSQTTSFEYDDLDRVTSETTAGSTATIINLYTYDLVGNRLSMTDEVGTTNYTYDNLYRLVTQAVPTQVGSSAVTTTYAYDLGGSRLTTQVGESGQYMGTTYEYYGNNWLKKEIFKSTPTSSTLITTEYTYDEAGKKKLVKYQNKTETAYEYCHETGGTVVSNHRLRKLTNRKANNGPVISFFEYTYDEVGNRLTMGELRGTNTYTYDNLYRLKTVAYPDSRDVTYSYDDAGNRITMVENVMDLVTRQYSQHTTTYTYDNANQMLTSTKDSVTTNYAWDLNGNQGTKTTGSTAMTCVWNGRDEMTGINYSGSKPSNSMRYNGDGKRVEYVSSEGTQRYVYEGNGTILETDETATITKKYNSGISMEIPAREGVTCKQQYFYLYDGLGSVVNLMDDGGNIVQVYYYDVYGASTNVKHDPTNKKQFTGKEVDEDSGLQYFLARYYDPEVGRFTSNDPIPHLNGYIYCYQNPVKSIDPDGQDAYVIIWQTQKKNTGHAGIAVENYTKEGLKDGTLTYYDLWPSKPVGYTEFQSDVAPNYNSKIINNLSEITESDPSVSGIEGVVSEKGEGRAPDSVARIETTYAQDQKMHKTAKDVSGKYNACSNNCSTNVQRVIQSAIPKFDASRIMKPTGVLKSYYKDASVVDPNNLYIKVKELPRSKEIKNGGEVSDKPYLDIYKGR